MTNEGRLALFREVLAELTKPATPDPTAEHGSVRRDDGPVARAVGHVDTLAEAFAKALSRYTTEDGSLKVANQTGSSLIGGS